MNTDLYISLLEEKIGNLQADVEYARERVARLATELDQKEDTIEALERSNDSLRDSLEVFWRREREAQAQDAQERLQREKREKYVHVSPIDLLPKLKGWNHARKAAFIAQIVTRLEDPREYIATIKHVRETFGMGLRESKEFVDCVQVNS